MEEDATLLYPESIQNRIIQPLNERRMENYKCQEKKRDLNEIPLVVAVYA